MRSELLSWEQALNIADSAAYIVKTNGRNGWVVLSGTPSITLDDAGSMPGSLEALLADKKVKMTTSLQGSIEVMSNRKSVA